MALQILFAFLFFTGMIFALVGSIMVLVAAFRESVLWGLAVLFIGGIATFVFLIMHWAEAKRGFMLQLMGVVMVFVGMGIAMSQGGQTFVNESPSLPAPMREVVARPLKRVERKPEPRQPVAGEIDGDFVGLTIPQVIKILGAPKAKVRSGAQTVLLYPGLELTSNDGITISHQGRPSN